MKRKILAVLIVFIIASLGISFWSYLSLQNLLRSIEVLSSPGRKMQLINETFQEIIEAENHFHLFALTGDTLAERVYQDKIADAESKIEELKSLLSEDAIQRKQLDSVEVVFKRKVEYLKAFFKLKKQRQETLFVNDALHSISNRLSDTAIVERQLTTQEILEGKKVPYRTQEVVVLPDDFKGFSGFVRKLLGRSRDRIDTVENISERMDFSQIIAVDTSIVRDYFADTTLLQVKSILNEFMKRESNLLKLLSEKELDLLLQNQAFVTIIQEVVDEMKRQEERNMVSSRFEASVMAKESTWVIGMIGFFGLVTGGVLALLLYRDVSRSARYRRQLELEKARTERLARAKDDFFSGLSHEIRTPLHNVLGFTGLLEQTALDKKQERYLKAINYSGAYLAGLLDDMLDRAKIEAGKLVLTPEPFRIPDLIDELKTVFGYSAKLKNLTFETHVSDELNTLTLIGDSFRIRQVLYNLLSNAVKFTDHGKVKLSVTGERTEKEVNVKIEVSDTGRGIDPEKIDAIFDPFVQESGKIAEAYGGTGLGLTISRRLVESMGGQISVESKPGEGSVFRITLSLSEDSSGSVEEISVDDAIAFRQREAVIMVVEDDDWNMLLLKELLSRYVSRTHFFKNATVALEALKKASPVPDLILTDIRLPGMDGVQFADEVRALKKNIPIVALTANAPSDRVLYDRGKFDFVGSKPFSVRDLVQILSKFLDHKPVASEAAKHVPDVSFLRKFAMDDASVYQDLLIRLIEDNQEQISQFNQYLRDKNVPELAELSHKLKTVYQELGIDAVSEKLASLELFYKTGQHKRVLDEAADVYPELIAVFERISLLKNQSRTA